MCDKGQAQDAGKEAERQRERKSDGQKGLGLGDQGQFGSFWPYLPCGGKIQICSSASLLSGGEIKTIQSS